MQKPRARWVSPRRRQGCLDRRGIAPNNINFIRKNGKSASIDYPGLHG